MLVNNISLDQSKYFLKSFGEDLNFNKQSLLEFVTKFFEEIYRVVIERPQFFKKIEKQITRLSDLDPNQITQIEDLQVKINLISESLKIQKLIQEKGFVSYTSDKLNKTFQKLEEKLKIENEKKAHLPSLLPSELEYSSDLTSPVGYIPPTLTTESDVDETITTSPENISKTIEKSLPSPAVNQSETKEEENSVNGPDLTTHETITQQTENILNEASKTSILSAVDLPETKEEHSVNKPDLTKYALAGLGAMTLGGIAYYLLRSTESPSNDAFIPSANLENTLEQAITTVKNPLEFTSALLPPFNPSEYYTKYKNFTSSPLPDLQVTDSHPLPPSIKTSLFNSFVSNIKEHARLPLLAASGLGLSLFNQNWIDQKKAFSSLNVIDPMTAFSSMGIIGGTLVGTLANIYENVSLFSKGSVICQAIKTNKVFSALNLFRQIEIKYIGALTPIIPLVLSFAATDKSKRDSKFMIKIKYDAMVTILMSAFVFAINRKLASKGHSSFDPSGHVMMKACALQGLIASLEYAKDFKTKATIVSTITLSVLTDAVFMANTAACYHTPLEVAAGLGYAALAHQAAQEIVNRDTWRHT